MAHLRAYMWNGGDMLELARYQRKEKEKEVPEEKPILTYREATKDLYMKRNETAVYAEKMQCSISNQLKHTLAHGMHSYIWHLL